MCVFALAHAFLECRGNMQSMGGIGRMEGMECTERNAFNECNELYVT